MSQQSSEHEVDSSRLMAQAALRVSFDDLPSEVVEATRHDVLDTLGVALGGRSTPGCHELNAMVLENYPTQQATVWGTGYKANVAEAAWANGAMAHALDFDDTHDPSVLHAGVSVVPAAMAAAEFVGGVSGKELVTAIAVGLDWICRMGAATTIGPIASGWMYTSLFGYFGATAAVGKLLHLNADQLTNALGIAYAQASGNTQCMIDGALTKRMQPGFAARAALGSALLARAGVTGTSGTFDGYSGLFRICLNKQYDRNVMLADVGRRFLGAELSFKPYPACRYTHTAIEAALELRRRHSIAAHTVERVEVGVNEHAYTNVCTPIGVKTRPRTIVDAQFSIPYCIATALIKGDVFLPDFTIPALGNDHVLALASRVIPRIDSAIQASHARDISPADVRIHLTDGTTLQILQMSSKGGPEHPMSFDELALKFRRCCEYGGYAKSDGRIEHLISLVREMESLPNVSGLAAAMGIEPK